MLDGGLRTKDKNDVLANGTKRKTKNEIYRVKKRQKNIFIITN